MMVIAILEWLGGIAGMMAIAFYLLGNQKRLAAIHQALFGLLLIAVLSCFLVDLIKQTGSFHRIDIIEDYLDLLMLFAWVMMVFSLSADHSSSEREGDSHRMFSRQLIYVFATLLVLNVVYSLSSFIKSRTTLAKFKDYRGPAMVAVVDMQRRSNNAIHKSLACVISGNESDRQAFDEWDDLFPAQLEAFRSFVAPQEDESLAILELVTRLQRQLADRTLRLFDELEDDGAVSQNSFREHELMVNEFGVQFERLRRIEREKYDESRARVSRILEDTSFELPILGGSSIALTLGLFGLLIWNFRRYSAEENRTRQKLKDEEELHRKLLDNLPEMIWVADTNQRCTFFNNSWLVFTGRTLSHELGKGWMDGIHPDDLDRCLKTSEAAFAVREPFTMEYRLRRYDGKYRWILDQGTPWFDCDERFAGFIGGCIDITGRRRAEQIVRQQNQLVTRELEKARRDLVVNTRLKAIGQVSAQVAHELRNPLGAVNNAVFYLKKQVPDHEQKWVEYLNLIDGEVATCNRFIGDLLNVTQGKEPGRDSINLVTLIEKALAHHSVPQHVELDVQCHPKPFEIFVDSVQIVQVLDNLLKNSLDAIGENPGRIEIRAHRTAENDIISVQDSGHGVPPQHRASIFDVMFTTKPTGTGLGLPICKQIIERHLGTIQLIEGASSVTTFEICLPHSVSG